MSPSQAAPSQRTPLTVLWAARPPGQPSGGDRYNAAVVEVWRATGRQVTVATVPGDWPVPDSDGEAALRVALDRVGAGPVLLDGLVAGACPAAVRDSAAQRHTCVLVHLPLPVEAADHGQDPHRVARQEGAALRSAQVVLATSQWAAQDLRRRYGLDQVITAPPGTSAAPVAAGSGSVPRLLTLASLTPRKNHWVLLDALTSLVHLPWTAVCAGPAPDPQFAVRLRHRAEELGLDERLSWPGPVSGQGLEEVWSGTDLLVLPSRAETFGMVVTEAHARGVPTVVTARTGAEEALLGGPEHDRPPGEAPGRAVRVDTPGPLAATLRAWLENAGLRRRWRAAALARRELLPRWDATAELVWEAATEQQARPAMSPGGRR